MFETEGGGSDSDVRQASIHSLQASYEGGEVGRARFLVLEERALLIGQEQAYEWMPGSRDTSATASLGEAWSAIHDLLDRQPLALWLKVGSVLFSNVISVCQLPIT
ncbi:hypothetical protein C8035_v007203 [Colletotrichum spinosum]|uniref:Uncharacterized protein n=1 Tax=Colletotrichum spinosum TaxID=1347390 RepID=A0A4R8PXG6_9PEZI|nr:hypothetical protein C8035_v007203 [Colletotrichum spinosum]